MNSIIYLGQVTACTAIFYLFYYLFLRKLTFFSINRWYLLSTVILSFLIPLIKLDIDQPKPYAAVVERVVYTYAPQQADMEEFVPMSAPVLMDQTMSWKDGLRLAYLAAVITLTVHLVITLFALFVKVKGKQITKLGRVNILSGDSKISNGSFLNYIFVNEADLSEDEIRQIIAHEMMHVRLCHSVDRIIIKLALIVLWFNPFIYLYARAVEENHEFEVDRSVANDTDKHNYANLLLHLSVAGNGMLYHNFSKVPLKKRITMLFIKPTTNMKKIIYLLFVPVVLTSVVAFASLKKNGYDTVMDSVEKVRKPDRTDTSKNGQKLPSKFAFRKELSSEMIRSKKMWDSIKRTPQYKRDSIAWDAIKDEPKTFKVLEKGNVVTERAHTGILLSCNGIKYSISTDYGQSKILNKLLKVGDEVQIKPFGRNFGGSSGNLNIMATYVIKNGEKIFELAEAKPLPKTAFTYEVNKVRFTDGQLSNIVKYPDGKWRSAVLETVNGYKFRLSFKQDGPDMSSLSWGDHVRLRFIGERNISNKTYQVNWVAISDDIEDYGIKNPDLFNKFYATLKQKNVNEPLKTDNETIDALYTRTPIKRPNLPAYDEVRVETYNGSYASTEVKPGSKVGFFIDKFFYTEDQLKGFSSKQLTALSHAPVIGVANSTHFDHLKKAGFKADLKGYSAVFYAFVHTKFYPNIFNDKTDSQGKISYSIRDRKSGKMFNYATTSWADSVSYDRTSGIEEYFGKANLLVENISVKADYIRLDTKKSQVFASSKRSATDNHGRTITENGPSKTTSDSVWLDYTATKFKFLGRPEQTVRGKF